MTEPHPAPTNLRSLTTRLDNLARQSARPIRRVRRTVANTVVGQMLPSGVDGASVRVLEPIENSTGDPPSLSLRLFRLECRVEKET